MTFAEIRFNGKKIIHGTKGGPVNKTAIVQTNGGREQRNAVWAYPLSMFEFDQRLIEESEAHYVRDFFMSMQGMLIGFRFKDYADYKDDGKGIVNTTGTGNNGSTGQLFKNYTTGGFSRIRKISKPVTGTVNVFVDGSPVGATVDYTTGVVTFGATSIGISSGVAVGTTSGNFTIVGHGLSGGDSINLTLGGSWGPASGLCAISVIDANTISIAKNFSTYGSFSSGSIGWYPLQRQNVTWTGEFDVPVRFDADDLSLQMTSADVLGYDGDGYGILGNKGFILNSLRIVELKI